MDDYMVAREKKCIASRLEKGSAKSLEEKIKEWKRWERKVSKRMIERVEQKRMANDKGGRWKFTAGLLSIRMLGKNMS